MKLNGWQPTIRQVTGVCIIAVMGFLATFHLTHLNSAAEDHKTLEAHGRRLTVLEAAAKEFIKMGKESLANQYTLMLRVNREDGYATTHAPGASAPFAFGVHINSNVFPEVIRGRSVEIRGLEGSNTTVDADVMGTFNSSDLKHILVLGKNVQNALGVPADKTRIQVLVRPFASNEKEVREHTHNND